MKNIFLERTSVRSYEKSSLTKELMVELKNVINNSPTSTNGQQFSSIIITDQEMLDWISKNNWGQQHIKDATGFILFVADRTRMNYVLEQKGLEVSEEIKMHEFMRATIDATIAATYTHDYLLSQGFGTCMIGGVLAYADELHEKLNIPKTSHVIVGLTYGKTVKTNAHKPKVNKVFLEKYNKDENAKELEEYIENTREYFSKLNEKSFDEQIKLSQTFHSEKGYGPSFYKGTKYFEKKLKEFK